MRSKARQQFRLSGAMRTTGTALFALILFMSSDALAQGPSQVGEWGNVQNNWPLQTIHASLTFKGDVLIWGWGMCDGSEEEDTRLWDPTTGTFTDVDSGEDFFCGGHATLPDGRIIAAGGGCHGEFNDQALAFSWNSGTPWESLSSMNHERWYPTLTTLGDGRILAISGSIDDAGGGTVSVPEVYDPGMDMWATLMGADLDLYPSFETLDHDLYPFMFVAPDGRVFMGRADPDADNDNHAFLDVENETWSVPPIAGPDFGHDSSAAMVDSVVIYSGGTGFEGHQLSKRIDLASANPQWSEQTVMNVAREHHDLVLMPDGKVLAVGGNENDLRAEWIDLSDSLPQWQALAASNEPRMYHSTTTLLPDGRVLAAGGQHGQDPVINLESAEIYSPPYLFTGTKRPIIGYAPRLTNYDTVIDVLLGQTSIGGQGPAPDAYDIAEVNLIRLGSTTHGFDQNQRFVSLNFSPESEGTLNVTTALNGNYAPPGDYMMFLISNAGAPSMAHFIRLDPDA